MIKCRTALPLIQNGKKTMSFSNCLLQKRWSVAATSIDFDNAELEAAKPFQDLPSMLCLPFVGTAWVHLPVIGNIFFTQRNINKRRIFLHVKPYFLRLICVIENDYECRV